MSDMEQIASSMMTDFVGAVKATEKAKRQQIDNIAGMIADAEEARSIGLAEVRRMQEAAAKMVAESLRAAEQDEDAYRDAMRAARAALNEMRGPAMVTGRVATAIAAE